jgi:hypothetical protein
MKKKYIFTLALIGIMLGVTLTIGTGYGVWISTRDKETKDAQTLDCFKVYYSDSDKIEMTNIKPVLKEEGMEKAPNTITITNICDEEKEVEIRLSVLKTTTIDTNSLTITASGYIEKDPMLYKNLDRAKTKDEEVLESKIIGKISVKPNETIRTNIKLWFDERKVPTITEEDTFNARYEIMDSAKAIKATFAETILANKTEAIDEKEKPDFSVGAYNDEGLYLYKDGEDKTYYYRGSTNNNYVKFANQTWRIVKINSNNSVELILDKSATFMKYNKYDESPDYVGLRYIYNNSLINNDVMDYLEDWYDKTIVSQGLDSYVAITPFCNDSSSYKNGRNTYFSAYDRLITNKAPSLECPSTKNDFGGKYVQKVGLISADEVALAGGVYNVNNTSYYLYNGENFMTLSPALYQPTGYVYGSYIFGVNNSGAINNKLSTDELGVRPVISLDPTVTVEGSGTVDNPYMIDLD